MGIPHLKKNLIWLFNYFTYFVSLNHFAFEESKVYFILLVQGFTNNKLECNHATLGGNTDKGGRDCAGVEG